MIPSARVPALLSFWLIGCSQTGEARSASKMNDATHTHQVETQGTTLVVDGKVFPREAEVKLVGPYVYLKNARHPSGTVVLHFATSATLERADQMLKSYGLEWKRASFSAPWLRVRCPAERRADLAREIGGSELVQRVKTRGQGSPERMLIMFAQSVRLPTATGWVANHGSLELVEVIQTPGNGSVSIPPGFEQQWVKVLQKEPLVARAALDTLAHIPKPPEPLSGN